MSRRQYQPVVEPFIGASLDAVTVDKWQPAPPRLPVRRLPTVALCMAASVAPIFVPDVTIQPLTWKGQQADRVPGLPRSHAALVAKTDAPIHVPDVTQPVTPLSWRGYQPDRIWRITLPRAAQPFFTHNLDPITNPIPTQGGGTIAALGAYDLWQYLALTGPLDVPVFAEVELQWQPVYPDAIRRPKRLTTGSQRAFAFDRFDAPDVAPDIPDQGPFVQHIGQVRSRPTTAYRAPFFAMDTQWTTPPQLVQTLGWRPIYQTIIHRKPYLRAAYTWAQPHFGITIQVPVMSWTGLYLDPPMRQRRAYAARAAGSVQPIALADITTPIPDMSWRGTDHTDQPRRKWSAALYQKAHPMFGTPIIPPDRSLQTVYPDRLYPRRALRTAAVLYEVVDPQWTAPAAVTVPDLSTPVYPDYVWRRAPNTHHHQWSGNVYLLDVTVPAPVMSWSPVLPDYIMRAIPRTLTPGGWMLTEPGLVTFAGFVRRTWYREAGTRRKGPTSRW